MVEMVIFMKYFVLYFIILYINSRSTWPKAMAIQALPNNVPNCLATLLSLVDDICYHTGDRSVDVRNFIFKKYF